MEDSPSQINFPSPELIGKIKKLPEFTADLSNFELDKKSPELIMHWASDLRDQTKDPTKKITLNISQASEEERAKLKEANEMLRKTDSPEIELFDEAAAIHEITHEISENLVEVDLLRRKFKKFIRKALENPKDLIAEYNTFTKRKPKTIEKIHYWDNIGIPDVQDDLRKQIMTLINETRADNQAILEEKVLPQLEDTESLTKKNDKLNALLLGMVSNMVRGVFYHFKDAEKVMGFRKSAIDTLTEDPPAIAKPTGPEKPAGLKKVAGPQTPPIKPKRSLLGKAWDWFTGLLS